MSKIVVAIGDIETTGLSQEQGHRIIEVCFSVWRFDAVARTRQKVGTMIQRINPLRDIDAGAQAVHGISLAELRGEPEWDAVAPKIQKLFDMTDVFVAHNGESFDGPFLALELIRAGLKLPNFKVFDTMTNARSCTPFGKVPNLGELCFALGVEYDPEKAHSAEYDVNVLVEAYWKGVDIGLYPCPHAYSLA